MYKKSYKILKRKNSLESYQWYKIFALCLMSVIAPLIVESVGYRTDGSTIDIIAGEVWGETVSNMVLYIWSGQITASLIIFTLLALISNKMDERILGIRIGTWLFKYNLYYLNLWECIVLIGLVNVESLFMLIIGRNFIIITNFMIIGALILFCCYFIFLVFYKRSRIYYRISLAIDPEEDRDIKGFSEDKIIKKIKGKKLVASNMKGEIKSGNKTLIYEESYHREEIIILAAIYFKLANSEDNVTKNKEILIKAISEILCSSGKKFSEIFKIDSEHCDFDIIIREYNSEYEELKKLVISSQREGD